MESIVSTPDPGDFPRPQQNGHRAGLVLGELRDDGPTEPGLAFAEDSGHSSGAEPGSGSGVEITPRLVAEQTSILDDELAALFEDGDTTAIGPSTDSALETGPDLLPGFEAFTSAALQTCPPWCIHQDLPVHSDGFDPDPDVAPHRGVEHGIHPVHGGAGIDHAGRADVTVQVEQDRDHSTGPVVTLSVIVRGTEQYAWLTLPETRALHSLLGHLLSDTDAT